MKRIVAVVLSFVLGIMLTGCELIYTEPKNAGPAGVDANEPGVQDSLFVREALSGTMHQMAVGRVGVERAEDLHLQMLAQKIFDDSNRARKQLHVIAVEEEINIPNVEQPDDGLDQLSGLSEAQFDQAYLRHMIDGHRTAIKKFSAAARNLRNSEVRDFAARTLPVLQEHLRMAENIGAMAGFAGEEINEPAGAERIEADPYYQGDSRRRYQFD